MKRISLLLSAVALCSAAPFTFAVDKSEPGKASDAAATPAADAAPAGSGTVGSSEPKGGFTGGAAQPKNELADEMKAAPKYAGKVTAVDAAAKTITVEEKGGTPQVLHVGESTRIRVGKKPAKWEDIKVGEEVRGRYKKMEGDKNHAYNVRIGA